MWPVWFKLKRTTHGKSHGHGLEDTNNTTREGKENDNQHKKDFFLGKRQFHPPSVLVLSICIFIIELRHGECCVERQCGKTKCYENAPNLENGMDQQKQMTYSMIPPLMMNGQAMDWTPCIRGITGSVTSPALVTFSASNVNTFSSSLSFVWPEQTLSLVAGRKGWTRKVPRRKPILMKKWRALMKGLLFSGPRVNTNRMLAEVRNIP